MSPMWKAVTLVSVNLESLGFFFFVLGLGFIFLSQLLCTQTN